MEKNIRAKAHQKQTSSQIALPILVGLLAAAAAGGIIYYFSLRDPAMLHKAAAFGTDVILVLLILLCIVTIFCLFLLIRLIHGWIHDLPEHTDTVIGKIDSTGKTIEKILQTAAEPFIAPQTWISGIRRIFKTNRP